MTQHTELSCECGKVQLRVEREPILCAECHCTSCRTAAAQLEALPPAHPFVEPNGGTQFVLYRKDRIHFVAGTGRLKEHRVKTSSKTRRVVATCCNTPVFLELESGHWLSLYSRLWPESTRPRIELRTMISDRTGGAWGPASDVYAIATGRRSQRTFRTRAGSRSRSC
jgi:hypothetical protein